MGPPAKAKMGYQDFKLKEWATVVSLYSFFTDCLKFCDKKFVWCKKIRDKKIMLYIKIKSSRKRERVHCNISFQILFSFLEFNLVCIQLFPWQQFFLARAFKKKIYVYPFAIYFIWYQWYQNSKKKNSKKMYQNLQKIKSIRST